MDDLRRKRLEKLAVASETGPTASPVVENTIATESIQKVGFLPDFSPFLRHFLLKNPSKQYPLLLRNSCPSLIKIGNIGLLKLSFK
jgi:hypothetical protein